MSLLIRFAGVNQLSCEIFGTGLDASTTGEAAYYLGKDAAASSGFCDGSLAFRSLWLCLTRLALALDNRFSVCTDAGYASPGCRRLLDMKDDPLKTWPSVGQKLVHKFRKKRGQVTAMVTEVDRKNSIVKVRVKGVIYDSLSAAAQAVNNGPANGWHFWGLKKQIRKR